MVRDIDSQADGAAITLRVVNFAKGPRYAKLMGATFDGTAKVWTLTLTPRNRPMLRAPGAYGLAIVSAAAPTAASGSWQRDPSYAEVEEAEVDRFRADSLTQEQG